MVKRSFALRFLFGLGLGAVVVLLAVFNTLLIWVATGPRELDQYTTYIESALSASDGSYKVKIHHTVLLWDGWRNPVDIKLRDVELLNRHDEVFSSFPDVSLGIHIPSLLLGKIRPARLTVVKPVINLTQHSDYSIGLGYDKIVTEEKTETQDVSPANIILGIFSGAQSSFEKMEMLNIMDGHFSIVDASGQSIFDANNTDLAFKKAEGNDIDLKGTSDVHYGDYKTKISTSIAFDKDGQTIAGGMQFDEVIPAELERLFTSQTLLEQFTMPTHGGIQFKILPKEQRIESMGFQVTAGQGKFTNELLDAPVSFDQIDLRGELVDNLTRLKIQHLASDLDGIKLSASGEISLSKPLSIKAAVMLEHADAKDVKILWPSKFAPISREWVTSSVTPANIPKAELSVDIKPGDLDKPELPREAIDAIIHIDNATIKYLPEHPAVTAVKADIHIDSISLNAALESGHYLQSAKLSKGTVVIDDLNADNPRIQVSFHAEADAQDAVRALRLPRLNHAEHLGLTDNMRGQVSTDATIGFDFYAPRDEQGNLAKDDKITYDVATVVSGITQNGVMHKFDLKDCGGTLRVTNENIIFIGSGNVNGADVREVDVKYMSQPQEDIDTIIKFKAKAPSESIARFGYSGLDFIKGSVDVDGQIEQGPKQQTATATVDLTQAEITQNPLTWLKPAGEKASLTLQTFLQDNNLTIPSFQLQGKDTDLSGMVSLNEDQSGIALIELKPSKFGQNSIERLKYEKQPDSFILDVEADEINLAGFLKDNKEGKGFSFQNFPAAKLNAKVKKFTLDESAPITDFNAQMNCSKMRCESANVTGKTSNVPFEFKILRNPNKKRQLSFQSDSAGLFLQAMGIYDGMQDGILTISGNFDDDGETRSQFQGKMIIGHFVLKKAPVLAKILSLASLTGFIDTLQGNGITFKQLSVPFILENDVISIKGGKAAGDAIGITMDGTITMPHVMLDLNGTVVPANSLNSGIGKVPLVGPLITGGKDQAVFAARYDVRNSYKDPKVNVNPLSMLAPGFLRNLFDVFDEPGKKKSQKVYPSTSHGAQ